MTIIFHVGPPKTGTSSFQNELWRASNLGVLGAYYPTHLDLNSLASQLVTMDAGFFDDMQQLIARFRESGFEKMMISAENFSDLGYVDFNVYNKNIEYFSRFNEIISDDEVVLMYTLSKNEYHRMESQVIEAIKHGAVFGSRTILNYIKSVPYFSAQMLFENIIRIIKPDKLAVITLISNETVFDEASKRFGLNFQKHNDIPVLNVSPSNEAIYMRHCFNDRISRATRDLSNVQINQLNNKINELHGSLFNNFSELSEYTVFLGLRSKCDLFSAIDLNFNQDREELVSYINKFSADCECFLKATESSIDYQVILNQ